MEKKFFLNLVGYFSVLALVFFGSLLCFKNTNAKVESSVSATANTGGNTITGGGTITTGDAKAEVNSKNTINGENIKTETTAKAEANGNNSKASVNVNGEQKSCTAENQEGCKVEINNTDNNSDTASNVNAAADSSVVNNSDSSANTTAPDKNIAEKIVGAVEDWTKSLTDKIISWFS